LRHGNTWTMGFGSGGANAMNKFRRIKHTVKTLASGLNRKKRKA
jgi:hypothetical protein